jgi:hypothetical protein
MVGGENVSERPVENGPSRAVEGGLGGGRSLQEAGDEEREAGARSVVERGVWSVEWSVDRRQGRDGKRAAGSNFDGDLMTIKRAISSSYRDGKDG